MRLLSVFGLAFLALGTAGFGMGALEPGAEIGLPTAIEAGDQVALADAGITDLGPVAEVDVVEVAPPGPPEPLRVGLQVGHWLNNEVPEELSGLRNNGGTQGGGKYEWEVNLEIARLTAVLLEEEGYAVDILPATVPQRYRSDVFIAIHADGNNDGSVNGFRVAAPRRDYTSRAQDFADVLSEAYGEVTGLRNIPTVTRRMQGYYAFNSRRYQHAIDRGTVGVIIETGFLTNARDREILVDGQEHAARGIFEGVRRYLGPALPELEEIETEQPRRSIITE